jgi:biotin carboxyl carrier protein
MGSAGSCVDSGVSQIALGIFVKLKITIENKTYEVDVEAYEPEPAVTPPRGYVIEPSSVRMPAKPAPSAVRPGESISDGPVDEDKVCRSPVSGIVVRIVAQPGQHLQAGDPILVLEAMKMETSITAPAAGKIARITAEAGERVANGQILAEFE